MKKTLLILLSLSVIFYSCEETESPDVNDTTPPTVTITSPQNNSTVSEIVTITCMSSDNVGVEKVELWVGGVSTGVEDNSEPYSLEWNTTELDDGEYTIIIRSYDGSDNTTDSDPLVLTVDNSQSYPTSVDIYPIKYENESFTVSWTTNTDDDFKSYTLFESLTEDTSSMINIFSSIIKTDTLYVVTGVSTGEIRYYKISIEDEFGFISNSTIVIGSSHNKILFVSSRDGNNEIYIMDETGNQQINLTTNSGFNFRPMWFPNGNHILFVQIFDSYRDVFIMDIDGRNQTNLSMSNDLDMEPHISSDGTKIVYRSRRGYDDIYTMDIDGSNQVQLTDNDRYVSEPQFSPDMSKITYVSRDDDGNNQIFIMDGDGSNKMNLTDTLGGGGPQFSPDGNKISFYSNRDGNSDIYLMNLDGSELVNLTNNTVWNYYKQFSPDGTQIVFSSERDDDFEIYTMNVDGTNPTRLTFVEGNDHSPIFKP